MGSVKIRKFNRSGLQAFEDLLDDLKSNPSHAEWNTNLKLKIDKILFDENLTAEFGDYEIKRDKKFDNRFEFGKYLYETFGSKHIEKETGILSWLALAFFYQICKKVGKTERLEILSKYRYIPEIDNSWRYYRHLILTPIVVWQRLKEDSILLLSNPLYESSDTVEKIMSRRDFIANKNMITVARKLYFDEEKRQRKVGAVTSSRPGNMQRLARDIVPQLSMTYDLYEAPVSQIMDLLPSEFDHWKNTG